MTLRAAAYESLLGGRYQVLAESPHFFLLFNLEAR
tara:strand:- start:1332 stop:1436 length:105 start_codon:yes stop_codon:yes gene_type:complete